MVTLLDIGNTHTRVADGFPDGSVGNLRVLNTADLVPELFGGEVAAASVVPSVRAALPPDAFCLSSTVEAGVDFRAVDAATLGADRVANALAAAEFLPLPAAVVDCGTAITFEVVDARKVFRGGAILPGRKLLRRAMHNGTAQLPEIAFSSEIPARSGVNTATSIALGVDRGAAGAVREVAEVLKNEFGPELRFFATGGDAAFFRAALPFLEDAGAELTLRGLLLGFLRARSRR